MQDLQHQSQTQQALPVLLVQQLQDVLSRVLPVLDLLPVLFQGNLERLDGGPRLRQQFGLHSRSRMHAIPSLGHAIKEDVPATLNQLSQRPVHRSTGALAGGDLAQELSELNLVIRPVKVLQQGR